MRTVAALSLLALLLAACSDDEGPKNAARIADLRTRLAAKRAELAVETPKATALSNKIIPLRTAWKQAGTDESKQAFDAASAAYDAQYAIVLKIRREIQELESSLRKLGVEEP